jgi:hypothetical protein
VRDNQAVSVRHFGPVTLQFFCAPLQVDARERSAENLIKSLTANMLIAYFVILFSKLLEGRLDLHR